MTSVIDEIDPSHSFHFILEPRHFRVTSADNEKNLSHVTPLPFPLLHVAIAIARHLSEELDMS